MAGNEVEHVVQKDGGEKNASAVEKFSAAVHEVWAKAQTGDSVANKTTGGNKGVDALVPSLQIDGLASLTRVEQQAGSDKNSDKTQRQSDAGAVDKLLPASTEGRIARSLNMISENAEFRARAAVGGSEVTQASLGSALLVDKFGHGVRGFLSKDEREAVNLLMEKWARLGTQGLDKDKLDLFSNDGIAKAVAKAVADGSEGLPKSGGAKSGSERPAQGTEGAGRPSSTSTEQASAVGSKESSSDADKATGKVSPQEVAVAKLLKQLADSSAVTGTASADQKSDTAALATSDFAKRAQSLFPKIDKDGDGVLSTQELSGALQDQQFKGQDAQVVAALYQNRDALSGLSNDQWGSESGVTISDLNRFEEVEKKRSASYGPAMAARDWMSNDENFKKVDTDGDGFASKGELEKAMQQSNLSDSDRQVLSFMLGNYDTLQSASDDEIGFENDGITRADLKKHVDNIYDEGESKVLGEVGGVLWRTSESQKGDANYSLYGSKNPADSITPDAIKQGMIGDCYFVSSLAALAKANPQAIEKMIKDNKDGTYTVTFPGAPGEPITVKAPTEAEAGLYNGVGKNGTWALVMEKAYGQYCQSSVLRRSPFNLGGGNAPAEGGDGGGRTASTMALLTGKGTDCDSLMFSSKAETAKKLEEAVKNGRMVTTGINGGLLPEFMGGSDKTSDGFHTRHAYSVVGFKPDGKGGGTVTIRNPWGGADGTTDGKIDITLDQFMKNFSDVTYETAT